MRKTILTLTLAALLLTSCAEVSENIKNDSSNISVQNRNSDDVDLSAYKHIYETENTLLFPHIPETVYRFDVKWSSESYADKYDEIGKAFVSNYDASRWESSTDPMDNAVYKNYIFEDSAASLGCSSNESFFISPIAHLRSALICPTVYKSVPKIWKENSYYLTAVR